MVRIETMTELSKRYAVSPTEFFRQGSTLAIKEKKRNLLIEKLEILSRYDVRTTKEFEGKIKTGVVPEHPGWEDLIEVKNSDAEIKAIEDDLRLPGRDVAMQRLYPEPT